MSAQGRRLLPQTKGVQCGGNEDTTNSGSACGEHFAPGRESHSCLAAGRASGVCTEPAPSALARCRTPLAPLTLPFSHLLRFCASRTPPVPSRGALCALFPFQAAGQGMLAMPAHPQPGEH